MRVAFFVVLLKIKAICLPRSNTQQGGKKPLRGLGYLKKDV
mgnify:CR=1 FL=1